MNIVRIFVAVAVIFPVVLIAQVCCRKKTEPFADKRPPEAHASLPILREKLPIKKHTPDTMTAPFDNDFKAAREYCRNEHFEITGVVAAVTKSKYQQVPVIEMHSSNKKWKLLFFFEHSEERIVCRIQPGHVVVLAGELTAIDEKDLDFENVKIVSDWVSEPDTPDELKSKPVASNRISAEVIGTSFSWAKSAATGKEVQKVHIHWKNTGTEGIRAVYASFKVCDEDGNTIEEVDKYCIYAVSNEKPGIQPGDECRTHDGYFLLHFGKKGVRTIAKIVECTTKGY